MHKEEVVTPIKQTKKAKEEVIIRKYVTKNVEGGDLFVFSVFNGIRLKDVIDNMGKYVDEFGKVCTFLS
jgi:hypothetical protein